MKNITYTKTADFVLDDGFTRYVMHNDDPNQFWSTFIAENHHLDYEIKSAQKLVVYLHSAQNIAVDINKQDELDKLLNKISRPTIPLYQSHAWLKYAAVILLLIVSVFAFDLQNSFLYKSYDALALNTQVLLSDGTIIDLRKGSSLQVSRFYNLFNRNVKLEGEAFFKVHRDENSRFIAEMNTSSVTVLGTSFNILSNLDSTVVMVSEGKVSFQSETEGDQLTLTKNKSAIYLPTKQIQTSTFELNQIGWSTGDFQFNDQKLPNILHQLETYYPVHFEISAKYQDKRLSLYISDMALDEVLALLTGIVPEMQIDRNKSIISIN